MVASGAHQTGLLSALAQIERELCPQILSNVLGAHTPPAAPSTEAPEKTLEPESGTKGGHHSG